MIGVGIVTYNRPERFKEAFDAIQNPLIDRYYHVKDGGSPKYNNYKDLHQLPENKGVGVCKNIIIDNLINQGCEHIFVLEDDCLITNEGVWRYCIDFSKHTGLLHFNWNNYREEDKNHVKVMFPEFEALISYNVEANFSYFHRDFLKEIRFDETYVNAWEHVDLEYQGVLKGFSPAFRMFVSPFHLSQFMRVNDAGKSSIVGYPLHKERIVEGYNYWLTKWGNRVTDIGPIPIDKFKGKMQEITKKYAKRNNPY
jgi:hypothetical protein